jgi:hypothetical protein
MEIVNTGDDTRPVAGKHISAIRTASDRSLEAGAR